MNFLFAARTIHIIGCFAFMLSLGGCTKEQENLQPAQAPVNNTVVGVTKLLATIADNEKPDAQNLESNHADTPPSGDLFNVIMNPYGRGAAYLARVGNQVRVVHNGKPGKFYDDIEIYTLKVSPDGQRVAYGAKIGDKWAAVVDGKEKGPFVERGRIAFSPDSRHVAYAARVGKNWHMFVDDKKNAGALEYYDEAKFSSDSSKLLLQEATDRDGVFQLVVTDVLFTKQTVHEVHSPAVAVSENKAIIAAIKKVDGKRQVIEFSFNQPEMVKAGALYDEVGNVVLGNDGKTLAYIAKKGAGIYLVLNGKEERIPDGLYPWPPVIRPDGKGAGIVIVGKKGAYVHQAFFNRGEKGNLYKECADLTYSNDGSRHAYVAIRNEKFTIVSNGKEGPFFDRVISPQFSPDGKFLVYRARQEGKRFVVVAEPNGRIIRELPRYERVFETTFTADGKSVAYGVKDGNKLIWKVEPLYNTR